MNILAGIFLGFGVFKVLCSVLKFTDIAQIKAIKRYKNKQNDDDILKNLKDILRTNFLKIIRLNEIKKEKLKRELFLANIDKEAEEFIADGLVDIAIFTIIGLICIIFNPLITIGFVIFAIFNYLNYLKEPTIQIRKNREIIENELYKFVSCIEQELSVDTDVVRILENFKNRTNEVFKRQLEITLTEMRTTDEINGLIKLEARINSSMLSEVVNGLISLLRGQNNREYFTTLVGIFKNNYINRKRKEASVMPDKLKKYEILLFLGIGILILTVIIVDIVKFFKQIF